MIPVLMYHHIAPAAGPQTVSVENFRDHLAFLKSNRIRTLSLADFDAWRAGQLRVKGKAVLLTFDDAWLDNWAWALPILQEFETPAVFFVVTSWPGDGAPRLEIVKGGNGWQAPCHGECMALGGTEQGDAVSMRWSELLAARETGLIELASHSHGHGAWWNMEGRWEDKRAALVDDLATSARVLQRKTGFRSSHFCWPKGYFSNGAMEIARQQGFITQFSTLRGGNASGRSTSMVRRINVENRSSEWLKQRFNLYSSSLTAPLLGLVHQNLHRSRMAKVCAGVPREEFAFPVLRPI